MKSRNKCKAAWNIVNTETKVKSECQTPVTVSVVFNDYIINSGYDANNTNEPDINLAINF